MAAGRSAVNAELMLHANHVHVRDVQKIRRAQIGGQVLLLNFKTHFRRIRIAVHKVIHRHDEALQRGEFFRHGTAQIRGERGDAAFPRQIIAQESDLADVRRRLHEARRGVNGFDLQRTCGTRMYPG